MWNWYINAHDTSAFPATDDIVVRIYNADYRAMKYGRAANLLPFTNPSVNVSRVNDESILASGFPGMFDHGLFVVSERMDDEHVRRKALLKKNLFFVFPNAKRDGGTGESLLAADHFSFCLDKNDKKTPLHLHRTLYMPDPYIPQMGETVHTNDFMPAAFTLPDTPAAFAASNILTYLVGYTPVLHAMLSRPWLPQQQQGGTRNRRRKERERARRPGQRSFGEAWIELPLHKVIVMAVRGPTGAYEVTIVVYDRLSGMKSDDSRHSCALLNVPRETVTNAVALEEQIARTFFSRLVWDSFRPYRE